jgi:hypothetical protein
MGARHRLTAGAAIAMFAIVACSSKTQTGAQDAGPPPAPPDRLAQGEIAEGQDKAFALRLPQRSKVSARFPKDIHVVSSHTPEELSNYVRAHVAEGKVASGTTVTEFRDVVVPTEPTRRLTIEVRNGAVAHARSMMIVRDTTPAPVEPGLTDEDRYKKAGLAPNGRVLDPKRLY